MRFRRRGWWCGRVHVYSRSILVGRDWGGLGPGCDGALFFGITCGFLNRGVWS